MNIKSLPEPNVFFTWFRLIPLVKSLQAPRLDITEEKRTLLNASFPPGFRSERISKATTCALPFMKTSQVDYRIFLS